MITNFTFASAKINESLFAPDMLDNIKGLLGADMGYISPDLYEYCFKWYVDLQKNMSDKKPLSVINRLKNASRNIETLIGQLSQRSNMQKVRARDLWHLSHRLIRKILSHNLCFVLNKKLGNPPLQFDLLISSWEWVIKYKVILLAFLYFDINLIKNLFIVLYIFIVL